MGLPAETVEFGQVGSGAGAGMGAWGIGLYSSDFALDVRGTVNVVTRLPFPPDRLLQYLCASQPAAANDPNDADHTLLAHGRRSIRQAWDRLRRSDHRAVAGQADAGGA